MRMDTSGRLLIVHNTYDADNGQRFRKRQVENYFCTVSGDALARTQTII